MMNPEGALQISLDDSFDSSVDGLPSGRLSAENEDELESKPSKKGKGLKARKAANRNQFKETQDI